MKNDKELEAFNILSGFSCFFEDNLTATDFINNPEVIKLIEEYRKVYSKKEFYSRFIKILIDNYVLDVGMQYNLYNALKDATELKIYNYRQFLIYKGHCLYDLEKGKKDIEDNSNLSTDLFQVLFNSGINEVMKEYGEILQKIASINKIDITRFLSILKKLVIAKSNNDYTEYGAVSALIKNYIKKYNAQVKEIFASNYSDENIKMIKKYFVPKKVERVDKELLDSIIKDYVKRNTSKLTNYIEAIFGKYIDDDLLYTFVSNFLEKDKVNFELLGLTEPPANKDQDMYNNYKRLQDNYFRKLNSLFDIEDYQLILSYINGNKDVCKNFNKKQQKFLKDMMPLVIKSKTKIIIDDNGKFVFYNNNIMPPTEYEAKLIEEYYDKVGYYNTLKSDFFNFKKEVSGFSDSENRHVSNLFNDSNYELNDDYEYLENLSFIAKIIDSIDKDICVKSDYNMYKNFLLQIIPCLLVSSDDNDLEFISNFFNYIDRLPKNTEFRIHELSIAYKMIDLYKFTDSESIDILGEEVCRKLIFNNQFIEVKQNDKDIKMRLEKALFVMSKAHDIKYSCIPYFDDINYENITLRRYNNVDPRVLTSGIDTNTCFKLDANDNDYIIYSILSGNGLLVEILDNGVFCGRITASLYYNVLILNGIRNTKNNYIPSNLEESNTNKNIIRAVELMAKKLIELTSNSECPIDHVCCNKAGILESNEYWQDKEKVDIISTPIDTLNDDYEEFKKIFRVHPEYLSQVDVSSEESNYNSSPFTTDFGSYTLVLIASREGKYLYNRRDIAYNVQKPIYPRPSFVSISGTGYMSPYEVRLCRKINALHVYKNDHIERDDTRICADLSRKFITYYITDTKAVFDSGTSKAIEYSI